MPAVAKRETGGEKPLSRKETADPCWCFSSQFRLLPDGPGYLPPKFAEHYAKNPNSFAAASRSELWSAKASREGPFMIVHHEVYTPRSVSRSPISVPLPGGTPALFIAARSAAGAWQMLI